jgi:predicted nucleic acid-binding protein
LRRAVRGELSALVGVPVIDELFYRLLLAQVKESTGRNPLEALRENLPGAIATYGPAVDTALRKLLALPRLQLVGVENDDGNKMLDNILLYSLLPRDALHLAIMQRLGVTAIASDDSDFDRVGGVERHWVIHPPSQKTQV